MIEQPLMVSTVAGPLAAMVTRPDADPVGAVFMSPGWPILRSHANQLLTRTARALADVGVASVRADYAGEGESWAADPQRRLDGSRELARWFDAEVGQVPTVLLAFCYGLSHVAAAGKEIATVAGSAVVNPPRMPMPASPRQRPRSTPKVALRWALRRPAAVPRRVVYRVRYGAVQGRHADQSDVYKPRDRFRMLVERGPVWVLVNSHEDAARELRYVTSTNDWASAIEVTFTDLVLRPPRSPEAQELIQRGLVDWTARCLDLTPTQRTPT